MIQFSDVPVGIASKVIIDNFHFRIGNTLLKYMVFILLLIYGLVATTCGRFVPVSTGKRHPQLLLQ
jgi:hypothetical protein